MGDVTTDSDRLRILIVNDVIATRELLWDLLEFQGHKVAFATSGEVALERLRGGKYDVLLLDPLLPDISGWDVLEQTREQNPGLCVVLLATRDNEVSALDTMRVGADGYVCVPVDEEDDEERLAIGLGEELGAVVSRSLERRKLLVENARLQEGLDAQREEAGAARRELEELRDQILETERNMAILSQANAASTELIQPLKVLIGRIDLLMQESVMDGQLIEEMIRLRRQALHMSPIVRRMGRITDGRAVPWLGGVGMTEVGQGVPNWG